MLEHAPQVLVIPTAHHENAYGIPQAALATVYAAAATVARALRVTYGGDGTSTRQQNAHYPQPS